MKKAKKKNDDEWFEERETLSEVVRCGFLVETESASFFSAVRPVS